MLKTTKRILDLPKSDRPQEKLLQKGSSNLTNAELLAIILGTGRRKQNVISLAEQILKQFPIEKISLVPLENLIKIPGIGRVKAARVLAAIELGQRIFSKETVNKTYIRSTLDMLSQLREIADKRQENLVVLYLNARDELIKKETIAIGNINAMHIELKEILSPALTNPAISIIMAHNHPSQDPDPSDADIIFTKKLQEAGEIMGIKLLEHLIICKSSYFSFAENKTFSI